LIAALRAAETERSGGQKGRGLGGRNFCPPSLSDSDFSAAAEFRISLCEMRRQEKRYCACPAHPCAGNKLPLLFFFTIIKYFGNIRLWEVKIFIYKYTTI